MSISENQIEIKGITYTAAPSNIRENYKGCDLLPVDTACPKINHRLACIPEARKDKRDIIWIKKMSTENLDLVSKENHDPVNHPSHYIRHPSGIECIQVTEYMTFNCGNAVKYIWRNGLKDGQPDIQDLQKAIWYLNREIERLGNKP